MEIPETRYARAAGVSLAYQVFGSGSLDLVFVPQWVSNLEITWENPLYARFLTQLARFARVVLVEPRGTGLSDRMQPNEVPPPEVLMEDLGTVMDAVGCERAVMFGGSGSADICALFAATYPARTSALVLYSAEPASGGDLSYAWNDEEWEAFFTEMSEGWGTAAYVESQLAWAMPSIAGDPEQLRWWGRLQRLAVTPTGMVTFERHWRELDVRGILPAIQVPTLVLHRTDDPVDDIEAGRETARLIPGARFVELAGADWLIWAGDQRAVLDEVESFVRGIGEQEARLDRVLATVLFTDIVDSTAQSAGMGDRNWREVRQEHDRIVRAQLARYRGREVKTMGDGFLATFEGPARGVHCAAAIVEAVRPLGIEVRAGVHIGEVELDGDDIAGLAVAIGARVSAEAGPSQVLVSSTVKDLVAGSGLAFEDAGEHELKGVPDRWRLYRVVGG